MAISILYLYHHALRYSAFSGTFVDVMPLLNNGYYILIKCLMLIGENAVLRDKMPCFIQISSSGLIFSEKKRLLFILFSVDE